MKHLQLQVRGLGGSGNQEIVHVLPFQYCNKHGTVSTIIYQLSLCLLQSFQSIAFIIILNSYLISFTHTPTHEEYTPSGEHCEVQY